MKSLSIDERGYPVPWFVAWIDGKPEFRVADAEKLHAAIRKSLCWVCGQPLGRWKVFVIGPMCAINRISAEPPNHRDCAEYSVRACPFLSRPQMTRRENDLPETYDEPAGCMIKRNPGVMLLWTTDSYRIMHAPAGHAGVLFEIGDPERVACYAEGRPATADEIRKSIETGLPLLRETAGSQSPLALAALEQQTREAKALLGV
jgi:hypothetical protein